MSLRWGICGGGKISHDFVVGIKTLPDGSHRVEAIATRSLESASQFAAYHHIEKCYGSYQDLAKDDKVGVTNSGYIHRYT